MPFDSQNFNGITIELGELTVRFIFPGYFKNECRNFVSTPHMHYVTELHFVLEGECTLVTEETVCLKKNSFCIIPPKVNHAMIAYESKCKAFNMLMALKYNRSKKAAGDNKKETGSPEGYYANVYDDLKDVLVYEGNEKISCYILDFFQAFINEEFSSEYIMKSTLTMLFFALTKLIEEQKNIKCEDIVIHKTFEDASCVDEALENFLMKNYRNNITLQDAAEYVNFSTAQLGRIIKKNYGMSYSKLITTLRMDYAKKLLLTTDKSIADIAKDVGYASYNGFGIAFKRYFGKCPEEVRKEEGEEL